MQSLYSIAHGGFGGTGLGPGIVTTPTGQQVVPDLNTDFIYSALAQELGLVGAAAILLLYMAFVLRGFQIALAATDGFSKLLAAGLSFGFAFQAFVIVGGITTGHPADGDHAPVRLVRRLEHRRQLPARRRPDADLEPREPRGSRSMNKQLRHVSVVALVLLAVLIVSTTYWQTWATADLAARKDNSVSLIARLTVDRGKFLGAGGTVLANNRRHRKNGVTIYTRHYPQNDLAPQVIGYATNAGHDDRARAVAGRLPDRREHEPHATRSSRRARQARRQDRARRRRDPHAAPRHPATRAATSSPDAAARSSCSTRRPAPCSRWPRRRPTTRTSCCSRHGFAKVKKIKGTCGDASALVNNATAGLYPPGSTFKMVTAAAALDSGAYTPSSPFNDPGYCTEYGQRVSNAGNPDQSGPEAFGNVTLAQGFEHSINSVFCNVGKHIGGEKILEYAKRFGFYSLPPLETPSNERLASGLYKNGKALRP